MYVIQIPAVFRSQFCRKISIFSCFYFIIVSVPVLKPDEFSTVNMDDLTDLLSKPRVYFAKKSTPDGSRIKVPEISIEKNLENSGLRDKNPDILSLPVQDQDEELRRSETDTQVIFLCF